jgi:hypothetical protein
MKFISMIEINKIERLNQDMEKLRIERDKIIDEYIGDDKQFDSFAGFNNYYCYKLTESSGQ